ncbi:MAG: DNA mismatch repair protein MutS [Clostridia bacterium]|nr:DNA mismatch repair protein MutS [Clostridia bacterium]
MQNPSPMMSQYLEIKGQYADHILLYRLGDFFECFFEDAVAVSRDLELTLTGRDCGDGLRAAMCGVPFHKADVYIGKLVELGYKVAVCEQTEDPSAAKGIVRREVVRVVTPGTVTDATVLPEGRNNYLAALAYGQTGVGLAFVDVSTGQVSATLIEGEDRLARLTNELGVFAPREAVINVPREGCLEVAAFLEERFSTRIEDRATRLFDPETARRECELCFGERARELGGDCLLLAVGALLSYIRETQKCEPTFARELTVYSDGQFMELDLATRRNLELCETMRSKEKRGSLLWVLDKTKTAMGARLLRSWVLRPLVSVGGIRRRQSAVGELAGDYMLREELRELLSHVLDLERLSARVVYGSASARDLRAIATSVAELPVLLSLLEGCRSDGLTELCRGFDPLYDVYETIEAAIVENPPFTVREGGMIREGYNADVDYLRGVRENGKGWIEEIETREREATGIKGLRVGYNKVFGYYIEVTKSNVAEVPDRYIRKQTLTNCERYITEQLKEMETTVLGAADKLAALEYELFTALRLKTAEAAARIQDTAARLAALDCYLSLAEVATKNHYVCPEIETSGELTIRDGRHPVVERFVKDSYFVPNDTLLDTERDRLYLITGPNMAGKSTYMRQVALITLMAQIGSFVPAREAVIGIADKIFTRVGASDDLASGQSTFMLEMNEVAHILENATARSLIIYDEVGRGTSTYDGMSIARAVAEYTHKKIGARTLFATHYHELTSLEGELPGIVNYNIAAKKRGDGIIFLRKIVRGATDDSYGIEVAKLAGIPADVVRRAKKILSDIEEGVGAPRPAAPRAEAATPDLFSTVQRSEADEAADRIRAVDLNTLTPIEAMNLLFELKKMLKD